MLGVVGADFEDECYAISILPRLRSLVGVRGGGRGWEAEKDGVV